MLHVCYIIITKGNRKRKVKVKKMLALMKKENGTRFTGIVFENEKAAELYFKQNDLSTWVYSVKEVEVVKEDAKALKRVDLEREYNKVAGMLKHVTEAYAKYKDSEDPLDKMVAEVQAEYIVEYTLKLNEIKKELENL